MQRRAAPTALAVAAACRRRATRRARGGAPVMSCGVNGRWSRRAKREAGVPDEARRGTGADDVAVPRRVKRGFLAGSRRRGGDGDDVRPGPRPGESAAARLLRRACGRHRRAREPQKQTVRRRGDRRRAGSFPGPRHERGEAASDRIGGNRLPVPFAPPEPGKRGGDGSTTTRAGGRPPSAPFAPMPGADRRPCRRGAQGPRRAPRSTPAVLSPGASAYRPHRPAYPVGRDTPDARAGSAAPGRAPGAENAFDAARRKILPRRHEQLTPP